MKKIIITGLFALSTLASCNKEQVVKHEAPECEVENLGYLEVRNELGYNQQAKVYVATSWEEPSDVEIILDGSYKIFEVIPGDVGCYIDAGTMTNGWVMHANPVIQCDTMVMTWMKDDVTKQMWFTYEPK